MRPTRPWIFRLNVGKRNFLVGGYDTEKEAAIARDRALLHYEIELPLNFPREARKQGPADIDTLRAEVNAAFKQTTTSVYRGVSVNKRNGRYIAEIVHAWVHHWLGEYDDEESAAVAYDEAALRLRGPGAKINFDTVAKSR